MNKILLAISAMLLSACSYSVTLAHTDGQASDIIDEQQTPTSEVTADWVKHD